MKLFVTLAMLCLVIVSCSAAQKGGILDQRGPCGGDALEVQCSWGGCCPKDYDCTTHSCVHEPIGPAFLGPS